MYGPEAAEDLPQAESEATQWLDQAALQEKPAPSVDDPFHGPLKPLPRPDDTDAFSLPLTPPQLQAANSA